jgi:hypothetical protein
MKLNKVNTDVDTIFVGYDAASTGNRIPVPGGKAVPLKHQTHPRRMENSASVLQKPQNSHEIYK